MPGSWGKRNVTKRAFFNRLSSLIKSELSPAQGGSPDSSFLNRNVITYTFSVPGNGKFFQSGCRPTQLSAWVSGKEAARLTSSVLTWNESRYVIIFSFK